MNFLGIKRKQNRNKQIIANPVHVHDFEAQPEVIKENRYGLLTDNERLDFEAVFLKEAKIKDRRQMYISGEFYDRISAYLRIISEGKVSMVGYIHNILAYHMIEFREVINELYQDKINKSNPL